MSFKFTVIGILFWMLGDIHIMVHEDALTAHIFFNILGGIFFALAIVAIPIAFDYKERK